MGEEKETADDDLQSLTIPFTRAPSFERRTRGFILSNLYDFNGLFLVVVSLF
jgi:hypothetical protein